MDIDVPASKDKLIQFSSDNTAGKQKRIVADLPVEAEDNLPWYVGVQHSTLLLEHLLMDGSPG